MNTSKLLGQGSVLCLAGALGLASSANAADGAAAESQETAGSRSAMVEEIIVTARKRDESLQTVPVAVTALDSRQLESLKIDRVADLGTVVPGLNLTVSTGASGGQLYLRGIGSADSSPFVEQAISIVVDGVQISDSRLLAAGLFDVSSIEVLRGPQALFFGKNSPGGVISVRSAKPTDTPEFTLSSGYEFEQDQMQVRGTASGPLTDTLGGRIALSYSDQEGRYDIKGVDDPALGAFESNESNAPNVKDIYARGSLFYAPTSRLSAHLNFAYTDSEGANRYATSQRIHCPLGTPQSFIPIDDCKLDEKTYWGNINPSILAQVTDGRSSEPAGFEDLEQYFGSLETKYEVTDDLVFTSVTGYYDSEQKNQSETSWQPSSLLSHTATVDNTQFSEEVRLTSQWDGPVNFNAGAYYEKKEGSWLIDVFLSPTLIGGTTAARLALHDADGEGEAYSAFAQVDYDITPELRLSGGGRYTTEKKDVDIVINGAQANLAENDHTWNDFSPEVTLRYTPAEDVMFYASYKQGFKSGGFDAGFNPNLQGAGPYDIRYNPEVVEGFEGGLKWSPFERSLALNLAVFSYEYDDLQVTVFDPATIAARIENAARAEVKGAELDVTWASPVEGLTFKGAVNYLDGEYSDFLADCYTGQTAAAGCQSSGGVSFQDQSGQPLTFASEWSGNLGFDYRIAMANAWSVDLGSSAIYTGDYHAMITDAPGSVQDDFVTFNVSAAIVSPGDRWHLSVRGVDLTNELRLGQVFEVPLSGGGGNRADLGTVGAGGRTVLAEVRYEFK